ncbi:TetR/AcrR family transcriptional regulator [Nocardioides sp. YIM 152588]|uniref:TetR/AcrR family transcriptional regulator n=1 Tax=Nocardioides sp. YIM 152588 TaxID=3158259 RepID=UPI0032E3E595
MDPRQRRSRDRLHRAVLELAASRPVDEVTMTAIAEAAGVHRSTVHDHADSPGELVRAALSAELDVLRAGLPEPGAIPEEVARAVTEITRGVVDHVLRHRAIYRVGLGDGAPGYGLPGMLSRHFRESGRILREVSGVDIEVDVAGHPHAAVAASAARFIADGTVGLLAEWIATDSTRAEDFLDVYGALLPDWWPRLATVEGSAPEGGAVS